MKAIIIIILIIIVICVRIFLSSNVEGYDTVNFNPMYKVSNDPNDVMKDKNIYDNQVLYDVKDYNEVLAVDSKENTYYQNDMINQDNITENAFDVIHQIDKIDYSNVVTGMDKCLKNCNGTCFELGYVGTATCYPPNTSTFDWGTLYKNPTFTYGYIAYSPSNIDNNEPEYKSIN